MGVGLRVGMAMEHSVSLSSLLSASLNGTAGTLDEQHRDAHQPSAPGDWHGDGLLVVCRAAVAPGSGMSASGLLLILMCVIGNPGCSGDLAGIACCLSDAFISQQQHGECTSPELTRCSSFHKHLLHVTRLLVLFCLLV